MQQRLNPSDVLARKQAGPSYHRPPGIRAIFGGAAAALLIGIGAGCAALGDDGQVPLFEVDPFWPMQLEYPYMLGPVSGVTVADDGNILIVTRQDGFNMGNEINSVTGTGTCCTPMAGVLEYAPDGSLVRDWGGRDQGHPWPNRPHGIAVDPQGNVWIGGGVGPPTPVPGAPGGGGGGGGAGAAPPEEIVDSFILKFSRTGEHLMTIGQPNQPANSQSTTGFGGAARFSFDADANEVYVADGYGNRRVAVLDIDTGELKRSWGAYGNAPEDADLGPYDPSASPAQQFRSVTCAELSNDGLVYVCDQHNNRIQVFETDGTFVSEVMIAPQTRGEGSVWDVAFSSDPQQRFLYVADGMNERVYVVARESLEVRTSFGDGGRVPGTFMKVGSVAVDGDGNVYTAENGQGRRIQRFVNTGMGEASALHQGAPWPSEYR